MPLSLHFVQTLYRYCLKKQSVPFALPRQHMPVVLLQVHFLPYSKNFERRCPQIDKAYHLS